jgi:hypothetical protein
MNAHIPGSPARTARLLSATIAGAAIFAGSSLLLHFLEPGLDPVQDALSYYMNQPSGWVLTLGLVALSIASISLAAAVGHATPDASSVTGRLLLHAWGTGVLIAAIFPPDPMGHWDRPPTSSGMAHGVAALAAFLAFPAAAILLSPTLSRAARCTSSAARYLRPLAFACAACLVIFFLCLAPASQNRPPYALGFVERILLALFVAWLAVAAACVRGYSNRPSNSTDVR